MTKVKRIVKKYYVDQGALHDHNRKCMIDALSSAGLIRQDKMKIPEKITDTNAAYESGWNECRAEIIAINRKSYSLPLTMRKLLC